MNLIFLDELLMNFFRVFWVWFSLPGIVYGNCDSYCNCRCHGTKKLVEPWFKPNHKGDCSGVSIWFEFQFKLVVMFSHCSQEVSLLVLYINNMEFHKGIIAGFSCSFQEVSLLMIFLFIWSLTKGIVRELQLGLNFYLSLLSSFPSMLPGNFSFEILQK